MNVTVFGLGYVGCVTACCLARDGHDVTGVDVSPDKVAMINSGRTPVIEPGLGDLLASVVRAGRLAATQDARGALARADIALICVGTPDVGHGHQDLEALGRVGADIAGACVGRTWPLDVVLRSTVLPGTTDRVLAPLFKGDGTVRLSVNPEFMREGSSLQDFDHPPFVLIGCEHDESAAALEQLYHRVDAPILRTGIRTAEMVKYVCNAFHALKICFTNEIADLCTALDADAQQVMEIVKQDRKLNVSPAYMTPGFAFGGSCLPKDLRALLCAARSHDVEAPLLASIVPSNDGQVRRGIDAVIATRRRRVGVVGLAFKPNTDDLRESPMVTLVETLIGKGLDVRILDGHVEMSRLTGANRRYIETEIPHISSLLCDDVGAFISHAEVLVFGTVGDEAARVRAAARPDQVIVDLTRGRVEAAAAQLGETDDQNLGARQALKVVRGRR
jgi:GDP-mannose 6-dehydrogenase